MKILKPQKNLMDFLEKVKISPRERIMAKFLKNHYLYWYTLLSINLHYYKLLSLFTKKFLVIKTIEKFTRNSKIL